MAHSRGGFASGHRVQWHQCQQKLLPARFSSAGHPWGRPPAGPPGPWASCRSAGHGTSL